MKKRNWFASGASLLLPYLVSVNGDSSDFAGAPTEVALSKGPYADVDRECSRKVISVDNPISVYFRFSAITLSMDHFPPPMKINAIAITTINT